jgi:anti-anti-sigma factor
MTERPSAPGPISDEIIVLPDAGVPPRRQTGSDEPTCTWPAEVNWQTVFGLREDLFSLLDKPDCIGVRVDVRSVTSIDSTGVGLLFAASRRATELGRRMILIDTNGPVSDALARVHLLHHFLVKQVAAEPSISATT